MVTRHEIEQWLEEGIIAAKAGQVEQARFRLLDVVEQDQTNETAWYWLYQVFHRHDDKRICLENLIIINPGNEWARNELQNYLTPEEAARYQAQTSSRSKPAKTSTPRPLVLKLVSAFWIGISLIFIGGGIIAAEEWLITGMRARTFPNYISALQAFEFMVAVIFIVTGIIGLVVAASLLARSTTGLYGSLLLALVLLVFGPTVSLIVTPPNYVSLVCTGGISGMIVFLTLAAYSDISNTQENDQARN